MDFFRGRSFDIVCDMLIEVVGVLKTSGESMENALRACCKGIKIGKILIHREGDNGKQVLFVL